MRVTIGPLLTFRANEALLAAKRSGEQSLECSFDLGRSVARAELHDEGWTFNGQRYAYFHGCKERSVYYWTGQGFEPLARFTGSLIKMVPTQWGTPTFEINGIKMLASERISPWADAERKVGLIRPRGKVILDTCGGLGYFAAFCLAARSAHVHSYEKNPDVIWLRAFNPWSPDNLEKRTTAVAMTLTNADVTQRIQEHANESVDAILHDPPRFGIAGELYSQVFYDELARVVKRRGRLFHYTGAPNKSAGRDLPCEVAARLKRAGFDTELCLDGVLAEKARKGS